MGKGIVFEPPRDCFFERDVASACAGTAARRLPLVLRVDDVPPILLDCPHRHIDFFALYVVRSGRGIHIIDDIPYGVSRGDVYAMGLGVTHCYTQCDNLVSDALYFAPQIFNRAVREALAEEPGFLSMFVAGLRPGAAGEGSGRWLHLTPDGYSVVAQQIAELRFEWNANSQTGTLLSQALFLRLLVHLARLNAGAAQSGDMRTASPTSGIRETTVAAAVRYMDEHFAEPLLIEQVAASVFLSTDRFTEVFAAAMGRTPRDYLRHLRLERARLLLTTTEESISAIGRESGFGDSAYFSRMFRAATGLTPKEYRNRARQSSRLEPLPPG
jgi:AraC family L-rhamnose operon regulatory protein RhaS